MITDYTTLTFEQSLAEFDAIASDARTTFGHLNPAQLNWKPGAEQWSVAQCLEHLIAANREFYPAFDAIVRGKKKRSLLERLPVLPGLIGRVMVKSLSPNSTQKFKAPGSVVPAASAIDPEIVNHFAAHQREITGRFRELESFDLARTIITSPFAAVMTYSLLDACRICVAHERRHFAQAVRVMETPGFPA